VASHVLARGLRLVLQGLALGAGVMLALAPVLRRFLSGVATFDGWSYAGATGMLLAVAVAASWLPARRASRVDPAEVMRAE